MNYTFAKRKKVPPGVPGVERLTRPQWAVSVTTQCEPYLRRVPPSVAPLPLLCQDAREVLRGDIEPAKPSLELTVVDGAVAVRVELGEELLHELLVVLGIVLDRRDGL